MDEEFEAALKPDYLARGENPEITLLYLNTGQRLTVPRWSQEAKRAIAFGQAIETAPSNPEFAAKWHAEMRSQVLEKWTKIEHSSSKRYLRHEDPYNIFMDFDRWCQERGVPSLPANEATVVLWMLDRIADDKMEVGHISRNALAIGKFHDLTGHPPRHLADTVRKDAQRALDFAKSALRRENVPLMHWRVPAKALDMFPNGEVPRRFDDIAA